MQTVTWTSTFKNTEIIALNTTKEEAEKWASQNRPAGWTVKSVSAVKGRPENFSIKFRRG